MSENTLVSDTVMDGFLYGFKETSVVRVNDEKCIVRLKDQNHEYEMHVPLVKGKRNGEARLLRYGVPHMLLHYENGSLSGKVVKLNESGAVVLRGQLSGGKEIGLFFEYNRDGSEEWIGFYRNGKRWRKALRSPNGKKYDYNSGEFYVAGEGEMEKVSLFEDGIEKRVLILINGNTMTEYDEKGRKYEGEFSTEKNNRFVRNGYGKEYYEGGVSVCYAGSWKNGQRDGFGTDFAKMNPCYSGEWKDGKRNGHGDEMNEDWSVKKRGKWTNGNYAG